MRKAIKQQGKRISAWRLGDDTIMEKKLLQEGKIKINDDGVYEIFSREAVFGIGEKANKGDYIKVDSSNIPYPNTKAYFETNHQHIENEIYEQIPSPVDVWFAGDEICEEIRFLVNYKSLKLNEEDFDTYFSAPLWGTLLSAAKDAAIVLYCIDRDVDGKIDDIDFNFVARDEFDKTYRFI